MKVLHVHRLRGIGGSERHLLALLPALRARGIDASFLGLDDGDPEPFYDALRALEIPHERLRAPRDLDVRLLRAVRRATRAARPDILHTHLVHADAYGAAAGTGTLVSTKHNDDPFRRGAFRHVERALTRRAARVICITEALRRFNRDVVGLPAGKLEVVHYGLDELPRAPASVEALGLDPSSRVLLAVARLVPQKGIDVALRALPSVVRAEPGAVLVVLGEGPERDALAALARSLGVERAVRFPGHVADVAGWLHRADLLVHPARWEGFGLVLLEAMLAGKPIVATRASAIPEVVSDAETGLLVPPDDPAALAAAVASLLAAPLEAARLGAAGRERARSRFSVERMCAGTLRVYEDALS